MPKVSQAHRDARREQILSAARRCFLRSGFHQTSMQDLFAECGLSSGAVYSYFASKDEVVLAIVEANMREGLANVHLLATERHDRGLGAALSDILVDVQKKNDDHQIGPMSVLAWAEALQNPSLAHRFDTLVSQMRSDLASMICSYQADGHLPGSISPEALARLFTLIISGFVLQLSLFGPEDVAGVPAAVEALWPPLN